jgi:hypothetical protein
MISPLSSFSRIIQAGWSQLPWRGDPDVEVVNKNSKYRKKKPPFHVPQPPAEGCPINSLPPEILSWIFQLGQQMDLDPESLYATDPGSDSGHEPDDSERVHHDLTTHTTPSGPSEDVPFPPEPIPVIDDDQNNSDWEDEDSDEDSDNDDDLSMESDFVDDSFQVTVSHVCKRWREVAIETPALWSEIDVETGIHATPSYRKASTYLSRTKEYPLSISIDVNDWDPDDDSAYSFQSDHQSQASSTQLQRIMALLLPHTRRWQNFKLSAEDYSHFHTVLSLLCDAPPASLLESLELHNFDEELRDGPHFFPDPSHKTPFVIFDNDAPKLRLVSLCGVHIDWQKTTFLKNLHSLELSYVSQDIRPSFDDFFTILRSSLQLRFLDLCMAGPCEPPHDWPAFLPPPPQSDHYHDPHVPAAFAVQPHTQDEYMTLPELHELKLSYQSPEELVAFFNRVSMPSLRILEFHLENHEYSDFIQSYLIAPPKWQRSSSRESRITNLKELRITQLPCTPKAIADLYAALVNLETIDLDFNCLDESFWEVLVPMKVDSVTTPADQLLPALHTVKVKGSSGGDLRQVVQARIEVGLPLKKLLIDIGSEIDADDEGWLKARVEGVEYFEGSDDDYTDDDESVSSIIEGGVAAFHI